MQNETATNYRDMLLRRHAQYEESQKVDPPKVLTYMQYCQKKDLAAWRLRWYKHFRQESNHG